MVVEFEQDPAADLEVSVAHQVAGHLLVGELLHLVPGGAHEADPVVGWLRLERRDVAAQVVDLGAAVAAVELPTVVTYGAPLVL